MALLWLTVLMQPFWLHRSYHTYVKERVKIVIFQQMTPQFQDGAKVVDILAGSWWNISLKAVNLTGRGTNWK